MKRIILSNTNVLNEIAQKADLRLPSHIVKALKQNRTSLGKHPSFPPDDEHSFDRKVAIQRFEDIKKSVANIDELTDYSESRISGVLGKLLKECQEHEKPIRNELEKLCFNTLTEIFDIPDGVITFSCKLVDRVKPQKYGLRLTSEPNTEVEFEDVTEAEATSDEVYKRRLINALIMGASMTYANTTAKKYIGEIYELDPKLPELYSKIIKLNDLLMYIKNDIELTDRNPMQGGLVNVTLGNEEIKSQIDVQALVFPILLSESIKGFMEIFAAHGLPERKDMAVYVTKKADFLLAEPWDMRLGPILWEYFMSAAGNPDTKDIPNLFVSIVKLTPSDFFPLMKEVFAKTKKGKKALQDIMNKNSHDVGYSDFENRLMQKRKGNGVIEDKYIQPDELLDY